MKWFSASQDGKSILILFEDFRIGGGLNSFIIVLNGEIED